MNKKIVTAFAVLLVGFVFAKDAIVESVEVVVPEVITESVIAKESEVKVVSEETEVKSDAKKTTKSEIAEVAIEKEPEIIKESAQESLSDIDFNEEDFDEEAVMQELEALLSQMQVSTEAK